MTLVTIGFGLLLVAALIFKFNKTLKRKMIVVAAIATVGVYSISGGVMVMQAIGSGPGGSAEEYKKAESYTVRNETIPSVYSVIKKDDLLFADQRSNEEDEGFGITMDYFMVMYGSPFTSEQKTNYIEALRNSGYKSETVRVEEVMESALLKNRLEENFFCMVMVGDDSVTFGCGDGDYETILDGYLLEDGGDE